MSRFAALFGSFALAVAPLAFAPSASAQPAPAPPPGPEPHAGDFVMHDVRFQSGETPGGAAHPLHDVRRAQARCGRPRDQRGADHARHRRGGDQPDPAGVHRRADRPGPAARRHALLPDPPRRHRPREVVEAERRHEGALPALRLRRHGRGRAPAGHRGAARRPPAPGDGHVDGLHACVHVGRGLAGHDRRVDAARLQHRADRRPQPGLARHGHRPHHPRSRHGRTATTRPSR